MNLKSKSKLFRTIVEKMDIALSEGENFDRIADKLKMFTLKWVKNIIDHCIQTCVVS